MAEDCTNPFPAQIIINFGSSKTDLSLKYRLGLEHALAKADFLNRPEIVLVQAFTLFLCVVRRHDSPRFVWMMTGLVIRMAQYLGLQRDGAHFEHLTPFEMEMRRRVWWAVCMLDVRASEDQGTDLTITSGSFDTKVPLNINDADINSETKEIPTERSGMTDMSFARMSVGLCDLTRQMMAPGVMDGAAGQENQSRLLNEIYQKYEHGYFPHATEPGNTAYWLGVTIARLVRAKMTLLVSLPVLFTSPSEHCTDEIRTKLLVSAIEVAEYNHAINVEQACRQWHWICQTYTHWHAIVYLIIEISRRPWSSIVERAWVALHSSWLIPAQTSVDKNSLIWFPLRKLMAKARKHRDAELNRLRADPQAAVSLDVEDRKIPLPSSSGTIPTGSSGNVFRDWWGLLVEIPERPRDHIKTSAVSGAGLADPSTGTSHTSPPTAKSVSAYNSGYSGPEMTFQSTCFGTGEPQAGEALESTNIRDHEPAIATHAPSESALGQTAGPLYNPFATVPSDWSDGRTGGPGLVPWLWADADPSIDMFSSLDMDSIDVNMDSDGEVNWYNWVQSAEGLEREREA